MPLFEIQPEAIVAVPMTTFAVEHVLERADLQRLLRAHVDVITDEVLVVAEEFGAFTEARRRIDLLGVDREGHLVVIELKRTADGGHLELQALRYAAMVSAMTFTDLVDHYEHYLARVEPDAVDDALRSSSAYQQHSHRLKGVATTANPAAHSCAKAVPPRNGSPKLCPVACCSWSLACASAL